MFLTNQPVSESAPFGVYRQGNEPKIEIPQRQRYFSDLRG